MENENEMQKTHNTHILSGSSEYNENDLNNSDSELLFPELNEANIKIHPYKKIDIKELFKNFSVREENKIIYLDESELDKEEKKENEQILNYFKNKNDKKNNKKNISGNIKDSLNHKTSMKEINTENFEIITKHKQKNNENEKNSINTNENNKSKDLDENKLNNEENSFNNDSDKKEINNKKNNIKKKKNDSNENELYLKNSSGKKSNNFSSSDEDEENEEDEENKKENKKQSSTKKNNNSKKISKNKEKEFIENNKLKKQKAIKNKFYMRDKSKSKSRDKSKDNFFLKNLKNTNVKNKELDKNKNKKLKNQKLFSSYKSTNSYSLSNIKHFSIRDLIKVRDVHTYKNKLKSTGNTSIQNQKYIKLYNFGFPKTNNKSIKKEIKLPVMRKCFFTKSIIQMDREQFILLNKKIKLSKENKIFKHKRKDYNKIIGKSNYINGLNFFDEINNKFLFDFDDENNNTQNFLNIIDMSKFKNNSDNNQRTFIYKEDLNSFMNSRIISPSILNRKKHKNFKKHEEYNPASPYLLNKINFKQKSLNKNNSAFNLFNNYNKNSNKKIPNIHNNHNSLKSLISNKNKQNDINLNFFKTNTIFNFKPKNNVFVPVIKDRPIESLKSANYQKLRTPYFKNIEVSTPTNLDSPSKINIDLKNFYHAKKNHFSDKEYGKHFGSEQNCPVCQSILMKISYNMKNINHYNDYIKTRDQDTIKFNKQQFLNDLKQPSTQSQKMEAHIIKEIKQFLNNSKKARNFRNNDLNDGSLINAYFGT